MKRRHHVENNVKKLYKMAKQNQIRFDSPIQRDDRQWSSMQKSKLIHTILVDYSIPPVYSVGVTTEGSDQMQYSILDGQQRLTTLFSYLDDEYPLDWKTPNVKWEGKEYKVAGKRFSQLDEELTDVIEDYSISMVYYVYLSEEEQAEMFDRLNNGSPLSRQQKAKARMGLTAAARLNELKAHPFIKKNAALSKNQHRRAEDEEVIVQSMMLLDKAYNLDSFSGKNMNRYASLMKRGKGPLMDEIESIMDYMHEALGDYKDATAMKKTIIPMIVTIGKQAKEMELPKEDFAQWVNEFKLSIENKGKIKVNYAEYMGAGSISRTKVNGRLRVANKHFSKFLEMKKNKQ